MLKPVVSRPDAKLFKESCISNWFPIIRDIGVKTPLTVILDMEKRFGPEIHEHFDSLYRRRGIEVKAAKEIIGYIFETCELIGCPCFIRTGHLSNKTEFETSALCTKKLDIEKCLMSLVEASRMHRQRLQVRHIVVRELLDNNPSFWAFRGRLPIAKERRYWIQDGEVKGHHPLLGESDIRFPSVLAFHELLKDLNHESEEEVDLLTMESTKIAQHFSDAWALDWMKAADGSWYLVDMERAECSSIWKDHPNAPKQSK